MDVNKGKAALEKCELFKSLKAADLDTLLENAQFKQLSTGKILYRKGEPSNDTFCLIISGSVHIVGTGGRIIKEMQGGEVVGEVALSNPHQIRTVNVITKEPVELLEWNVNQIKDKIPEIWSKLLKLAWKNIAHYYEG